MDNNHLKLYYPDGISMEQRLFELGGRLTRSGIGSWIPNIALGIVLAVLGVLIITASYDGVVIGSIVFGLGDLLVLIGIFGISRFIYGLRCLERAELLYNTRCTSGQKSAVEYKEQNFPKKEKIKAKEKEPEVYGSKFSEEREEFVESVLKTSTEDLKLILKDQRELYSEAELSIMEEVLEKRLSR